MPPRPGWSRSGASTEALSFVPGVGMPGKAWELARPVWVRDVRSDPRVRARAVRAGRVGLAAGIAVPVLARDDVVAVMEFFMSEEREEDERLVALVSAVAAQLGTLIQQKQAEEALRASEEHFRAVADTAADAILSLDRRGNIAYANAAATRIFGHPVEELIGRPVTDVLPGGVPAADRTSPARLVEVDRAARQAAAPAEFPLEAAFSRWSAGGETFMTAVLRDISARKRDQAAVHEAEERFRGAFEQAPIGMALVSIESDRAGCFLRVNRALCEIIGHSPEEMVGRAFESLVDPSDEDSSDARYVPWMLAGEVRGYEVEKRLRRADGETIVATVAVSLVRDAQERPLYLIVQVQDVTARKRAEAALVESSERVQAIIDNTPAVIYVKDMEGRYTLVNRSFEALFGIDRERATGRTDEELFPAHVAAAMRANDRRVLREQVPLQVEEVVDQADGPHTYLSAKFPLRDAGGEPYAVCAIATDITERKRAEEALRESEQHFRRIVDTAHDAFISIDASGAHHRVEPAGGGRPSAGPRARRSGRNLAETIIPRALPRHPQPRARAVHGDRQGIAARQARGAGGPASRRAPVPGRDDDHRGPRRRHLRVQRVPARHHASASRPRRRLRRLAEVVQASHDAIVATATRGEITAWNAGAAELYGYQAEEVIGHELDLLMPPRTARRPTARCWRRRWRAAGWRTTRPSTPQGRQPRARVADRVADARLSPRDRRRVGDRARPHRAQARRGGDARGAGGVPPRVRGRADRDGAVRREPRPSAAACCRSTTPSARSPATRRASSRR